MKIVLTGAAGFIGSHLAERLVGDGHEVLGLDNFDEFYSPATKRANLEALGDSSTFSLREIDIRDRESVTAALNGAETVIHLAARAGVRPSFESPSAYSDINVFGTAVLLEAMRELSIPRFIFASSSSVYGDGAEPPFSEDALLGLPESPYAGTKACGEMLCRNFATYASQMIALRFFTVYGPRQRPDMAVHKFARLMIEDKPLPIFGPPKEALRDLTYIDDVIDGITACLDLDTNWSVINLGSGRQVTLADIVSELEAALGISALKESLPRQPGDVRQTHADITRAKELLGYEPKYEFAAGVRRFADWFLNQQARPAQPRL